MLWRELQSLEKWRASKLFRRVCLIAADNQGERMNMRSRQKKTVEPTATASGEPPEATASGEPPGGITQESLQLARPGTKSSDVQRLPVAWGNIVVDSLKIKDPAGMARRLRSELELGEGARTDYGRVLEALDRSATNFEGAARLARAAKLEDLAFGAQVAVRVESMRTSAMAELMAEYRAKERKSPTKDDIEDRMIQSWPDEYTEIKTRLAELHGAFRTLETLRDAWASRCADLRIMADKARPVR